MKDCCLCNGQKPIQTPFGKGDLDLPAILGRIRRYDTEELRRHYHISNLFEKDSINLTYSHQDRIIAGGIMPVEEALVLESCKELAAPYFLARRDSVCAAPPCRSTTRRPSSPPAGPSIPAWAPRATPSSGACAAKTRPLTTWTASPPLSFADMRGGAENESV